MKVLLISVGSRGDCEPFLGVGEVLRERGIDVFCSFPEQYRCLAEESNFKFYSLGSEFIDMLDTNAGKIALGGDVKGMKKIGATLQLAKISGPIQTVLVERQKKIFEEIDPDLVIFHSKVMYAIPWSIEKKRRAIILATVPFMIHKLSQSDAKNYTKEFNPTLCDITNFSTALAIKNITKKYVDSKVSATMIREALLKSKIFYAISEELFQKPPYWPNHAMMAGFLERNKRINFSPSNDLKIFLEKHPKILFVTFGSMTNINPQEKTRVLLDIVSKHHIPTIINISGGGFAEIENDDKENILFLKSVPYDWILKRVYATIHHGGIGTLSSSLKAGCATMAIPHAVDQPMWNHMIHQKKVGPKGIHIADFTKGALEEKILDLYTNPLYKENARQISEKIQKEDKGDELFKFIIE